MSMSSAARLRPVKRWALTVGDDIHMVNARTIREALSTAARQGIEHDDIENVEHIDEARECVVCGGPTVPNGGGIHPWRHVTTGTVVANHPTHDAQNKNSR